jgi:hypothetical protein
MPLTREALMEERRGYVSRGLEDRVAQVDEELAKLDDAETVEYETLNTDGLGATVDINSSVDAGGALLAEPDPTRREPNDQPDTAPNAETTEVAKASNPSEPAKVAAKVAAAAKEPRRSRTGGAAKS